MLILPSRKISENLSQYIEKGTQPVARFLNGFRNKISENFEWVLVHDDHFSGQGFCYQVIQSQEERQKLQKYEDSSSKIEVIVGNYVLVVKGDVKYARPQTLANLPGTKMEALRNQIAHPSKEVEDNLLLNNFESYEAYKQSGLSLISPVSNDSPIILDGEYKKFSEQRSFFVPRLDAKTGHWSYDNEIELKLQKKVEKHEETDKQKCE